MNVYEVNFQHSKSFLTAKIEVSSKTVEDALKRAADSLISTHYRHLYTTFLRVVDSPSELLYKELFEIMKTYSNYGAEDSEGYSAVSEVELAVINGKPFPLQGPNPFDLYSHKPGWESVSQTLVVKAKEYWREALIERLGL